jgi:hypothetical protein
LGSDAGGCGLRIDAITGTEGVEIGAVGPSEMSRTFGVSIRIYRAHPGMAGAWAQLLKSYLPVREKYSPIVGLWTGEAPQPNEAVHMWNYPDLNARMQARSAAGADPQWREFLRRGAATLAEMQSIILLPTSFSPMR